MSTNNVTHFRPLLFVLVGLSSFSAASFSAPVVPLGAPNFSTPIAEKIPVALDATLNKEKFGVDEPVNLTVTLTNRGDQPVYLGTGGDMYSAFEIILTSSQPAGELPNHAGAITAFGQRMFTSRGMFGNSVIILPPKGTQRIVFPLQQMFDLSNGGDYTVRVDRTFEIVRSGTTPEQPKGIGGFATHSYRREFEVKTSSSHQFSVASPEDVISEVSP